MTDITTTDWDIRELAHRAGGGSEVTLLWSPQCDRVWGQVYERVRESLFEVPVAHDQALNAFRHPYAYAALTGHYGAFIDLAPAA